MDALGQSNLCFLDLPASSEQGLSMLGALADSSPAIPVVVLVAEGDSDLILSSLRSGAAEFLIRPFSAQQLRAVLAKLAQTHHLVWEPNSRRARVIGFFPGKGGSGASTVAYNLAFRMKALEVGNVLLADLDGRMGATGFLLKLKPKHSFVDGLMHSGSLDADIWKGLTVASGGLDVLLPPEDPADAMPDLPPPDCLLAYARRQYDLVVIDGQSVFGDWNEVVAANCDDVLVVTGPDPASLHATSRALRYMRERRTASPQIVLNRHVPKTAEEKAGIERTLASSILHSIPCDEGPVSRAVLNGTPVPAGSRFGKSVSALAQVLLGVKPAAAGPSLFARVLQALRPGR
jgi:pilus assembly protein CpaE